MIHNEWDKDVFSIDIKQLWMEGHEQQLLHQRSYNHEVEVDQAALYWQASHMPRGLTSSRILAYQTWSKEMVGRASFRA